MCVCACVYVCMCVLLCNIVNTVPRGGGGGGGGGRFTTTVFLSINMKEIPIIMYLLKDSSRGLHYVASLHFHLIVLSLSVCLPSVSLSRVCLSVWQARLAVSTSSHLCRIHPSLYPSLHFFTHPDLSSLQQQVMLEF